MQITMLINFGLLFIRITPRLQNRMRTQVVETHVFCCCCCCCFLPHHQDLLFFGREREAGGKKRRNTNFLQTKGSRDIGLLDHPDIGLVEMTYPLYQ